MLKGQTKEWCYVDIFVKKVTLGKWIQNQIITDNVLEGHTIVSWNVSQVVSKSLVPIIPENTLCKGLQFGSCLNIRSIIEELLVVSQPIKVHGERKGNDGWMASHPDFVSNPLDESLDLGFWQHLNAPFSNIQLAVVLQIPVDVVDGNRHGSLERDGKNTFSDTVSWIRSMRIHVGQTAGSHSVSDSESRWRRYSSHLSICNGIKSESSM